MEDGVSGVIGVNVLPLVEEEHETGQELVTTQLLHQEEVTVQAISQKQRLVVQIHVQVCI